MTTRTVFSLLSIVAAAGCARAQDRPPAAKGEKQPPTLEQRLALLEEQAAKLLTEIKAIRGQLKAAPPPANLGNINIYRLKNIDANQIAKLLSDLLDLNRGNKSLRVVADAQTNSLIVAGKPDDQDVIQAIISRLDEGENERPRKK